MSDDDIKTMEDMEFNEILFISKSGGRLQSWRGWFGGDGGVVVQVDRADHPRDAVRVVGLTR